MAITVDQRVVDLIHSGHGIEEVASLMAVSGNHIRSLIQTIGNAATGLPAPASLTQRAVDLAYAGHGVPEIANLTGLQENAIKAALQDGTKTPAQATSALTGASATAAPAAGGAGALPATPRGYITVLVNGTARQVPYY